MLQRLDRFLAYEMKVSEFIGTLIILAVPYLGIGLVWSLNHTDHLRDLGRVDAVVSFLGQMVCWPVLTFANVSMR